jgi:hypothetical protein
MQKLPIHDTGWELQACICVKYLYENGPNTTYKKANDLKTGKYKSILQNLLTYTYNMARLLVMNM